MNKKIGFLVLIVILIGILAFIGYRWYAFNECKKIEGRICETVGDQSSETEQTQYKYTKCNFWKGKTC